MQTWTTTLTGAICGALIAVAAIFMLANAGYMPINEAQLHGYLLHHPQLITAMTDALQQQEDAKTAASQQAVMQKIGLDAFFDPKIAFVTGPADAKKSLVEFYDYDCPYCRASLPAVMKYYALHKNDTRFSFIEFPIPSLHGPGATLAARASLAARRQDPDKYLLLHFALMSEKDPIDEPMIYAAAHKAGLDVDRLKTDMARPDVTDALAASHDLAHRAGIDGTPTFIANGMMHPGAVDDATLAEAMKQG